MVVARGWGVGGRLVWLSRGVGGCGVWVVLGGLGCLWWKPGGGWWQVVVVGVVFVCGC